MSWIAAIVSFLVFLWEVYSFFVVHSVWKDSHGTGVQDQGWMHKMEILALNLESQENKSHESEKLDEWIKAVDYIVERI
jgi:hypothetical protein